MKYLIERRNAKPGQIGVVAFITVCPWLRFRVGFARSEKGWFSSLQISRFRVNVECRTAAGFSSP